MDKNAVSVSITFSYLLSFVIRKSNFAFTPTYADPLYSVELHDSYQVEWVQSVRKHNVLNRIIDCIRTVLSWPDN